LTQINNSVGEGYSGEVEEDVALLRDVEGDASAAMLGSIDSGPMWRMLNYYLLPG
jgi:hypothetical protein